MDESHYDLAAARKAFSRIGLAFCAILVITWVLQVLWVTIPTAIWGEDNWATSTSWGMWLYASIPLYCFAIPTGLLILRKLPAQAPQEAQLDRSDFFIFLPICFCLMYTGNLLGTGLSYLLSSGTAENAVESFAMDNHPLKFVVIVILAPLLEEYVCRKQLIDRTRQYGEKTAVLLSALVFGLLHQNLFQFFYAFALGLVFAYIYTRTGRLRYSVAIHCIINFMGSVIAPWLVSMTNEAALSGIDPFALPPSLLLTALYGMFLIGMSIAGLVLLISKSRQLIWKEAAAPLPRGTAAKTVYLNVGMVLYILLCIASFVLALL